MSFRGAVKFATSSLENSSFVQLETFCTLVPIPFCFVFKIVSITRSMIRV